MAKQEIAVDQVVEHERPALVFPVVLRLVGHLDVVVTAFIHPGVLVLFRFEVAGLLADSPPFAHAAEGCER